MKQVHQSLAPKLQSVKKRKVVNDPVYGFVSIPNALLLYLISHPYFQRLRRIAQLGLTYLVYPGANHTRFQHAIGAMHLMQQAVETLRQKDVEITDEEYHAVMCAILLHDIGHGPFSHALENSLVECVNHEQISLRLMHLLNAELGGELDLCIAIFTNQYSKKFLHQLVSSQLDMDRLDYLKRDSFFSGVSEGVVGSGRIIKMLTVVNDQIVVESKGIYSIEKFLVARRLMYWQVYLHKTVIGAEYALLKCLKRAKYLVQSGHQVVAPPALQLFLAENPTAQAFADDPKYIEAFVALDDTDIIATVKQWTAHPDKVLQIMANAIVYRKIFKAELRDEAPSEQEFADKRKQVAKAFDLSIDEAEWLLITQKVTNNAYNANEDKINIQYKDGSLKDIAQAADLLNISALSQSVAKYLWAYPKI